MFKGIFVVTNIAFFLDEYSFFFIKNVFLCKQKNCREVP